MLKSEKDYQSVWSLSCLHMGQGYCIDCLFFLLEDL